MLGSVTVANRESARSRWASSSKKNKFWDSYDSQITRGDKCRYFDISPDTIVNTARQVVGLVNEVPIPEMPKYIQQKVQEKAKLENETEKNEGEK